MKFNPFKRAELPQKDVEVSTHNTLIPEEENINKKKTIADVVKAQDEIKTLQDKREALLQDLRTNKNTARQYGVNEFVSDNSKKRTETFNDLVSDTERELAEVGGKISEIRENFDLQPKYMEVLEKRSERVLQEIDRIKHELAMEYRDALSVIKNFFGEKEGDNRALATARDYSHFSMFIDAMNKYDNFPVVQKLLSEVPSIDKNNEVEIVKFVNKFRRVLEAEIKEECIYKTPAEESEAFLRIDKAVRLYDEIAKTKHDVGYKEGRFADQSRYF